MSASFSGLPWNAACSGAVKVSAHAAVSGSRYRGGMHGPCRQPGNRKEGALHG